MIILTALGPWYKNHAPARPAARQRLRRADRVAARAGAARDRGADRADLLQVLLSGEPHQLLYFLSDAPLPRLDRDGADRSVRLPGGVGGRHGLRRPDRRPARPQDRDLGLDPRRRAVHARSALCRTRGDGRLERADRTGAVLGVLGDRRLCPGADAGPRRHGLRPVLRARLRHGRRRRRGAWAKWRIGPASSSSTASAPSCR